MRQVPSQVNRDWLVRSGMLRELPQALCAPAQSVQPSPSAAPQPAAVAGPQHSVQPLHTTTATAASVPEMGTQQGAQVPVTSRPSAVDSSQRHSNPAAGTQAALNSSPHEHGRARQNTQQPATSRPRKRAQPSASGKQPACDRPLKGANARPSGDTPPHAQAPPSGQDRGNPGSAALRHRSEQGAGSPAVSGRALRSTQEPGPAREAANVAARPPRPPNASLLAPQLATPARRPAAVRESSRTERGKAPPRSRPVQQTQPAAAARAAPKSTPQAPKSSPQAPKSRPQARGKPAQRSESAQLASARGASAPLPTPATPTVRATDARATAESSGLAQTPRRVGVEGGGATAGRGRAAARRATLAIRAASPPSPPSPPSPATAVPRGQGKGAKGKQKKPSGESEWELVRESAKSKLGWSDNHFESICDEIDKRRVPKENRRARRRHAHVPLPVT